LSASVQWSLPSLCTQQHVSTVFPVSEHRIFPDACIPQAEVQQLFLASFVWLSWASALIAETASSAPQAVAIRLLIDISDLLFNAHRARGAIQSQWMKRLRWTAEDQIRRTIARAEKLAGVGTYNGAAWLATCEWTSTTAGAPCPDGGGTTGSGTGD